MDIIMKADIPMEKKIIFNEIRLHLQLMTAVDLVILGSGSTILPYISNGVNHRKSSLEWPNTKPFPSKWLKTWRSLLSTFIQPRLHSNPLCVNRKQDHQTWSTYASPDHNYISYQGCVYNRFGNTRSAKYLPTSEAIEFTALADVALHGTNMI